MTIERIHLELVLVEDFKRILFGVEIVRGDEFDYILFSFGAGGLVIGWKWGFETPKPSRKNGRAC